MPNQSMKLSLVGMQNAKEKLPTPSLLLDLDIVEENILTMAQKARHYGVMLRPHSKSHKSSFLAKLQMEAGACGICCPDLKTAQEMAKADIDHILITCPIVTPEKIVKLIDLNEKIKQLLIVCDNKTNVCDLAKMARGKKPLNVLIDFDISQESTGVKTKEEAISLALLIKTFPELQLQGIQAHSCFLQTIPYYEKRKSLILEQNQKILTLVEELKTQGFSCPIITGGGTGSFEIDLQEKVYTELQPSSYLFMCAKYQNVELTLEKNIPFKPALFVLTSVISQAKTFAITDAGRQAFGFDSSYPHIALQKPSSLNYTFTKDNLGKITWERPTESLDLGEKLLCIPPLCDLTVNLYDSFFCLRKNSVIDLWPIQEKGFC